MFRYRVLSSASLLVLCSGVSPSVGDLAQTAERTLPPVTIDAPRAARCKTLA